MLNLRTLLFGLIFGLLDAVCLPLIKSVSIGTWKPIWMAVPLLLYGASPFLFLYGLKGETLTILNLVWDLSSDVIITLIGLLIFAEKISSIKMLGVCFSFVALFLMAYEGDGFEEYLDGNFSRIQGFLGFKQ